MHDTKKNLIVYLKFQLNSSSYFYLLNVATLRGGQDKCLKFDQRGAPFLYFEENAGDTEKQQQCGLCSAIGGGGDDIQHLVAVEGPGCCPLYSESSGLWFPVVAASWSDFFWGMTLIPAHFPRLSSTFPINPVSYPTPS